MSETLISVENVGKKFCRDLKKSLWYGVKDSLNDLVKRESYSDLRADEFWANQGISFELKRGECLGLVGRNGAGKTTLLKILSGLIKPDIGRISIRGRVGAMIALGAGFNPVLTGRENIQVNASVLGLTQRQIKEKIDGIIDFSEIGDFIDAPVRTYSSEMKVRLGFSIATTLDPDILFLDEVLAVGDVAFRNKCYRCIDDMREKCAIVFVSHNIPSVSRISTKGMVLSRGKVLFYGDSLEAVRLYSADGNRATSTRATKNCFDPIVDIGISELPDEIDYREHLIGKLNVVAREPVDGYGLQINIKDLGEQYLASFCLPPGNPEYSLKAGENRIRIELKSIPLRPTECTLSFTLMDHRGGLIANLSDGHEFAVCGGSIGCVAACQLDVAIEHLNSPIST